MGLGPLLAIITGYQRKRDLLVVVPSLLSLKPLEHIPSKCISRLIKWELAIT
jgi:hypothetical protein